MRNKINLSRRLGIYRQARQQFGDNHQLYVALEEMSECQKEICKMLRGNGDTDCLAEEVADALIGLEQVQMIFGIKKDVAKYMTEKLERLTKRIERGSDT